MQLNTSEALSSLICTDCQVRLDESYRLKLQITETQRKLNDLLEECGEITIEFVQIRNGELGTEETIMLNNSPEKKAIDKCCPYCKRIFSSHRDLSIHIERVHEQQKNFGCDMCEYKCYKKFDMILHHRNIHLKDSSSDKKVLCPECGISVRNNSDLRRHHLKKHLRVKRFKCEECNFSCYEKSVLRVHSQIHLPMDSRNLFPCEICGKVLSTRNTLNAHVSAIHKNIRSFACSWCPKTFAQKSCLLKHQNSVHLMIKEHQCDVCNIYVSQACYLKKHKQMMHPPDGKKIKYPCTNCAQSFSTAQALKNHETIHGDPEFQCKCCSKKFYRKGNLLDHMEHHETLEFPCTHCKRSFRNESKLNHHLKVVHFKTASTYRCDICSSTFTRRTTCRDHVLKQHKDVEEGYLKDLLKKISTMLPEEQK